MERKYGREGRTPRYLALFINHAESVLRSYKLSVSWESYLYTILLNLETVVRFPIN